MTKKGLIQITFLAVQDSSIGEIVSQFVSH